MAGRIVPLLWHFAMLLPQQSNARCCNTTRVHLATQNLASSLSLPYSLPHSVPRSRDLSTLCILSCPLVLSLVLAVGLVRSTQLVWLSFGLPSLCCCCCASSLLLSVLVPLYLTLWGPSGPSICCSAVKMAATTSSALDHSTFYPNKVDKHASALSSFDAQDLTAKKSDLQQSTQALPQQQQQQANQPLPGHVKTFAQILASVGYMSINEGIYQKLRSIYPLVRSSPELITPAEWNLANLYKCDVYHHGCYFTTSSEHAFLDHLSSEHPTLSLFCFYCTKSGHGDSCHNVEGHSQFSQPEQLVRIH